MKRKGNEKMVEKSEMELFIEQLREERGEIIELKMEVKKHRSKNIEFDQMMEKWDSEISIFKRSVSHQ